MMHFYKTQRGIEVLQDRSLPLTARQRRLLVLIGSQDFNLLNDALKQQLAPAEILDQLYAMELIGPAETCNLIHCQKTAEIKVDTKIDLVHSESHRLLNSSSGMNQDNHSHLPEPQALYFEDLKYLMMESLQKYCGLMAKQQVQHISLARDARSLKLCQMQWTTSLQESRIAPQELNHILKQINFALDQLQQNEVHE
ncbi:MULTISPECIES: hypothetical protein [unclassified Acinetobacter]|uniref:hypothetical protein n=1 Tax=unclassified Acinetobacter TaxID=196816 RepID=UPI003A86CF40